MKRYLWLALFPVALGAQDARDTVLATRIRAACDTASSWRTGQQTTAVRRGFAVCKAAADSLKLKRVVIQPPPTNQAPVAGFGVTINDTTRLVRATSTSTDDKGIAAYAWAWGDGATSTATGSAQHTYAQAGTYTVSLIVRDAEGLTSTATKSVTLAAPIVVPPSDTGVTPVPQPPPPTDTARFAGAAELPRAQVSTVTPTPTRRVPVPNGWPLQDALNAAQPGDEYVLAMGSTFVGNFVLPAKSGTGWITVRADTVPVALGTRIRPSVAGRLPKLRTPNGQPALSVSAAGARYRVIGLDISNLPLTDEQYGLVEVWGTDVILDRLYVHGATDTSNVRRGIALNGVRDAVIDSWISDIHSRGTDSQAVSCWDGDGPYLIRNSRLEAAGENFMCGGSDPSVSGRVMSDITIIGNHFFKPQSWRGSEFQIKNLLELKNARRVLIEGNVFDGSWAAAQDGWAFIWGSHNQYGGDWGNWTVVRDVTFRWNQLRNAEGGLVMTADYDGSATPGLNFTVTDNDFGTINGVDNGKLFLMNSALAGITLARNTGVANKTLLQIGAPSGARFPSLSVVGNRMGGAVYPINSPLGDGRAMLDAYAIPLASFTGNTIQRASSDYLLNPTTLPGNTFVDLLSQLTSGGVDQAALAKKLTGVVVAP